MNKLIKIGLNAMVVFTMMFATTVSVVAQEKINASDNNVEVKESVEANALAGTVHELNAQWAQNKAYNGPVNIEVMKAPKKEEPVVRDRVVVLAEAWFDVLVTDPSDQNDPENQEIEEMLDGSPEAPCNDETGTLCAVKISYDATDPQTQALISRIGTSNPPTVEDFENLDEPATATDHAYNDEQ